MAKDEDRNEIIAHQWDTLRILWEGCRASVADATEREEIDKLFPSDAAVWSSDASDWRQLNHAEQRVGAHLDATTLAVEYGALLGIARSRSAPDLASYEERKSLFEDPLPAGVTLAQQRVVYLSLLQSLQGVFIETRFRRRLRRQTAGRLFWFGVGALLIAFAPMLVYLAVGFDAAKSGPGFVMAMVATLGVLGAYFSRALSFQSKLASIGFDDVMNLYQWRMLALRLLYGMIGAIIFYYAIRAGVLGGGAFPDIKNLSIDPLVPPTQAILAPGADLAKLLIWSFLAGFSERLVPDALGRTEASANKTTGP